MNKIRLNKYLKDLGISSRRKADEFIEKGYIKLNGKVVKELGTKIDIEKDVIEISDKLKKEKENYVYLVLNKPKGYVTSKNKKEGKTVLELLPNIKNLTYAGRLDKESEGLLIFSNDGEFVFKITYPDFEKEKEYLVTVDKKINEKLLDKMRKGMVIDNKQTKPTKIKKVNEYSYKIILTEGINRQIRKMAKKVGLNVKKLIRIRIKNIYIDSVEYGKWRYLKKDEIKEMLENIKK
ncbi:pseudouridine synthase [Haliovirga abyssi]|uniref:Pseudouridine synthase n=1 Tax=Haliovirga abyssi TaxID=2996794 RepID=A0AAU9D9J1_9FUSO|nr:pseudouridine synthase [Haliovirga abyssi]BDU50256.1 pseudouridine synthase [Haliovirga abyssi]